MRLFVVMIFLLAIFFQNSFAIDKNDSIEAKNIEKCQISNKDAIVLETKEKNGSTKNNDIEKSQNTKKDSSKWETKDFIQLGSVFVVFVVGLANLVFNWRSYNDEKTNNFKDFKRKQLYDFYAPLEAYLILSKKLSEIFKATHESQQQNSEFLDRDGRFRTLLYLLHVDTLSDTEKNLLDQILKIGTNIEKLIIKQSGLINYKKFDYMKNNETSNLLTDGLAHIRIIRMVFEGNISISQFNGKAEDYAFPTDLTQRVKVLKDKLHRELYPIKNEMDQSAN